MSEVLDPVAADRAVCSLLGAFGYGDAADAAATASEAGLQLDVQILLHHCGARQWDDVLTAVDAITVHGRGWSGEPAVTALVEAVFLVHEGQPVEWVAAHLRSHERG